MKYDEEFERDWREMKAQQYPTVFDALLLVVGLAALMAVVLL